MPFINYFQLCIKVHPDSLIDPAVAQGKARGGWSGNNVTKSKSRQTHVLFRMIVSLFSTSYVALNLS